jgi:hypothetical protein
MPVGQWQRAVQPVPVLELVPVPELPSVPVLLRGSEPVR